MRRWGLRFHAASLAWSDAAQALPRVRTAALGCRLPPLWRIGRPARLPRAVRVGLLELPLGADSAAPTRRDHAAEASLAMPIGGHAGFAGVSVPPLPAWPLAL